MTFRQVVLITHRWIGVSTSLVLAIVGTTGAIILLPGRSLIRRASGPLHQSLALGPVGWWIVVAVTALSVLLELGGLYLWWKRKTFRVRTGGGWRRTVADLHYSAGAIGLVLMLLLAVTGVLMAFVTPQNAPEARRLIFNLHTTRSFSLPVKLIYAAGTLGFLLQGITGVAMWWPRRRSA